MKKVIGIFLTMVLAFVVLMSNVYASEIADVYPDEGYDLVREWAKNQGWNDWYNITGDGFVGHSCGALSMKDFENETGLDWSMETFEKALIEQWDLCECRIKQVGEIEGNNIYLIEAQSETKVIGTIWNDETNSYDDYYCASVLFMVCGKH